MSRYIKVDDARDCMINLINNIPATGLADYINEYFDTVKGEDVKEVVRGEWLDTGLYGYFHSPIYQCSHCKKEVEDNYIKNHNYCLHCGADMRGDKK